MQARILLMKCTNWYKKPIKRRRVHESRVYRARRLVTSPALLARLDNQTALVPGPEVCVTVNARSHRFCGPCAPYPACTDASPKMAT